MELLIINNEDSDFYEEDELAMVKTAVIFSEKITVVNYSFKDLVFYCNLDKLTDKQLMDYYLKTLMESDMPNKEYHIIDGKRMFKDMMELKKRKFKDHNSIIYLGQLEKNFAGIKKHTEEEDKTWLEEENMYPLVNFYNDKTLNVIIHDPTEDKENESIPDRLIEAFTGSDAMQFFNGIILSDKDFPYDSPSEFLSEVLFEIPNLDSLSYPQLKIIRNELTETFKPFYDAVSGMQKEFSATLYKEENLEYIEQRTSEILDPYFALLKDTVENNIYIQQIKHQSDHYTINTLHFCVVNIEKVVGFYSENEVITEDEKEYILKNISLKKDLDTCCFFFYNYSYEKNYADKKVPPLTNEE